MWCFFLLLFDTASAAERGWVHRVWTREDGLPVDHVDDLTVDTDGVLWIATIDGLVRFDGERFRRFTVKDGLPASAIDAVRARDDGHLWVRTTAGHLLDWDGEQGQTLFKSSSLPLPMPYQSPEGTTWAADDRGVVAVGSALEPLDLGRRVTIHSIHGSDADLWIGTQGDGVFRVRGAQVQRWTVDDGLPAASARQVLAVGDRALAGTVNGAVWISGRGIEPVMWRGEPLSARVSSLRASENGILMGTNRGLFRIAEDVTRIEAAGDERTSVGPVVHGGGVEWSVVGDRVLRDDALAWSIDPQWGGVRAAAVDRYGGLWVATSRRGLHLLRPSIVSAPALPVENLYALELDASGAMWAGSQGGGLVRWTEAGNVHHWPAIGGSPVIYSLEVGPDDSLLVGTLGAGLLHFRDGLDLPPERLGGSEVRAILAEEHGVWAGTKDGVRYAPWGETLGTPSGPVAPRHFARDDAGRLWVASRGEGLWQLDGTWQAIGDDFPSALPRWVYPRSAEEIWVATEDHGIVLLTGGDPWTVQQFGTDQGLPDDGAHAILPWGTDDLWVSTNRGLYRVSRAELLRTAGTGRRVGVQWLTESDGLPHAEANGGTGSAALATGDGLWFATQAGAVQVDPSALPTERAVAPLFLDLQVAGGPVIGDAVSVPAGGAELQLGLATPELHRAARTAFRYRLDDEPWTVLPSGERLRFAYLPPGQHRLEAQAADDVAGWGPSRALHIDVAYAWWQRPTAIVVGVLLGFGFAGLGWWGQRQVARRRQERLQELIAARTTELRVAREAAEAARDTIAEQATALQRADAARSRFFANVSHEFRTPLTLLMGPLHRLAGRTESEDQAQSVRVALQSAQRLLGMVDQLLDAAQADAGVVELQLVPADLRPLIREMGLRFLPLAERCGVELIVSTPAEACGAAIDADAMEKVLGNLLANALKFSAEGDRVQLTLVREESTLAIEVSDQGPGIPGDMLPHLFRPFVRRADDATRHVPGTGLGLSLSHELTVLQRGELTVQTVEGVGSTFCVRLPREEVAAVVAEERPAPEAKRDDGPLILVVDDHPGIRALLRSELSSQWRVQEAGDGAEVLQMVRAELPDLVLSDVMMPGMDGVSLCKALRADAETAFVPVVLLTAGVDLDSRVRGLEAGADDFIEKPFHPDALRARVRNLIAQRKAWRAAWTPPAPKPSVEPSADQAYMDRVRRIVHEHLADEAFGVEELARRVGQERTHLYRRVHALTGAPPSALLRQMRLERATELLRRSAGTVSEIAYAVGFRSVSSFSRAYKTAYGVSPSRVAKLEPA